MLDIDQLLSNEETRRELRCSENWVGLRESRRCWEFAEEMKRAAQMKCAKEMASLVDCTEKEINAVVGSRSDGNCNSDLIRKFKGGVYLKIAKSRIISLFYRINHKFIQLSFGP